MGLIFARVCAGMAAVARGDAEANEQAGGGGDPLATGKATGAPGGRKEGKESGLVWGVDRK